MTSYPEHCGLLLDGRYELRHVLGAGGFATVYLALDRRLHDREVAIKVLHPEHLTSADHVVRFAREIKVAARIGASCEHLVKITDHGRCDAPPLLYFVMEYLAGPSLRQVLTDLGASAQNNRRVQRPLPWRRAVTLTLQLCAAMTALHRHGVVHRDIKPENLIIEASGVGELLKLLDYGIAELVPGAAISGDGPRTAVRHVLGTPRYMAPEQLREGACDHRVDIFAAGAILAELLTGEPPRPPGAAPLSSLSQRDPDIPSALDAVVLRATAPDPEDRHASAAELSAALVSVLRDAATAAAADDATTLTAPRGASPPHPAPDPAPPGPVEPRPTAPPGADPHRPTAPPGADPHRPAALTSADPHRPAALTSANDHGPARPSAAPGPARPTVAPRPAAPTSAADPHPAAPPAIPADVTQRAPAHAARSGSDPAARDRRTRWLGRLAGATFLATSTLGALALTFALFTVVRHARSQPPGPADRLLREDLERAEADLIARVEPRPARRPGITPPRPPAASPEPAVMDPPAPATPSEALQPEAPAAPQPSQPAPVPSSPPPPAAPQPEAPAAPQPEAPAAPQPAPPAPAPADSSPPADPVPSLTLEQIARAAERKIRARCGSRGGDRMVEYTIVFAPGSQRVVEVRVEGEHKARELGDCVETAALKIDFRGARDRVKELPRALYRM